MAIKEELINTLEEPCRSAAEVTIHILILDSDVSDTSLLQAMLCHYAFPDCVILAGDAAGLPLCYEDCIALRQHFCYSEWSHIVKQKERGITYKSRGHFRLPDCDNLPRIGLTNNTCTQTGITDMRYDLVTSKILIEIYMATISGQFSGSWVLEK